MLYIGEISALTAAFLWSFSSFVFTAASRKIGALQINLFRLLITAVLLTGTIWITGISYNISYNQLIFLSLSGIIGLTIGDSFLFKSFKEIGPRVSMLIASSNPAVAALLAFLILGERLSLWSVLGIAITLSGIYLVVLENHPEAKIKITKKGAIFAFLAAAGQGTGLIFAKLAFRDGDINSFVATFVRIISSMIILYPVTMFIQRKYNPLKGLFKSTRVFLLIIIGSIFGPYIGITLSFIAITNTKIGIASTLMSTVPIIMLPISVLYFKEKLSWKAITGAFIAVFGVALLFLI